MADLPADVGTGIVRIHLRRSILDGGEQVVVPAVGKVVFTPSTDLLRHEGNGLLIPTFPVSVYLSTGDAVVELMATDDPQVEPVNFTYRVDYDLEDLAIASYHIAIPEGSDVELSDITPVEASSGSGGWGGDVVIVDGTAPYDGWLVLTGPPDTTAPTGGTLSAADTGTGRISMSITGAADNVGGKGLHAQPYAFSTDGGTTFSAWQSSASFTSEKVSAGTYTPRAKVRDSSFNELLLAASPVTVVTPNPSGAYEPAILALNPSIYWSLGDAVGATNIVVQGTESSQNSGAHALTNVTFGQGGIGDRETCARIALGSIIPNVNTNTSGGGQLFGGTVLTLTLLMDLESTALSNDAFTGMLVQVFGSVYLGMGRTSIIKASMSGSGMTIDETPVPAIKYQDRQMVSMTCDATTMKIYRNAVLVGSKPQVLGTFGSSKFQVMSNASWTGKVAGVAGWHNRALTQPELLTLAQAAGLA